MGILIVCDKLTMRWNEDVKFELSCDEAVFLQVWLGPVRGSVVGCIVEQGG
jgi:hypothetical protein